MEDKINFGQFVIFCHFNADKINRQCEKPEKMLLIYIHLFVQKKLRGVDDKRESFCI